MAFGGESVKRAAYVRVANKADVPIIKLLVEALAKFEKQTCQATESALESTLFLQPPFLGPTVLLLELASTLPPSASPPQPISLSADGIFQEKYQEVSLSADLEDPLSATFVSAKDKSRTVVGFVLVFPNYTSNLAKFGLYIGDFYVREAYRRQGLGTVLLQTVAQQAARRGLGRVDWCVLDWNVNAIKFYESMGAVVMQEWRVCRSTGDTLQAYGA